MALVPFPSPQSGALQRPPDDDDDEVVAGRMSFLEHLEELRKRIINACLGVAVGIGASFFFIQTIYDFLTAPAISHASRGQQTHLHAADRSVLALHHHLAHQRRGVRGAVHHVSGLDVHRPGPLREREEVRHSLRAVLDAGISRGRRVQPLRGLPVHHDLLRQLQHAEPHLHAAVERGVRPIREDAARSRRRLPDAHRRLISSRRSASSPPASCSVSSSTPSSSSSSWRQSSRRPATRSR